MKNIKYITTILLLTLSITSYGKNHYHLISEIGTSAKMISIGGVQGFDNSAKFLRILLRYLNLKMSHYLFFMLVY
jgi:hypothetical protein